MRIFSQNGAQYPFKTVIEKTHTFAVRNIATLELPFEATLSTDFIDKQKMKPSENCVNNSTKIQGGSLYAYPIDQSINNV